MGLDIQLYRCNLTNYLAMKKAEKDFIEYEENLLNNLGRTYSELTSEEKNTVRYKLVQKAYALGLGLLWYLQALQIVIETIDWVLEQPDRDNYYLCWYS